jgi:hypothetical protein
MASLQKFAYAVIESSSGERNGRETGKMLNTVRIDVALVTNSFNW